MYLHDFNSIFSADKDIALDRPRASCLSLVEIKSFRDPDTEKIFKRRPVRRLPHDIQQRAFIRLNAIDAATSLEDLRLPPSNRLEALKGNRKGEYSIRINDQWRICFQWRDGDAEQVEIVDYH